MSRAKPTVKKKPVPPKRKAKAGSKTKMPGKSMPKPKPKPSRSGKRGAQPTAPRRPKPPPAATTIGVNPLDAPVSTAAVIAAILGPAAGRRAELRAGKRRR